MPAQPQPSFQSLAPELLRGIIEAVGPRPGDSGEQTARRQETIVLAVMAHLPRDAVETMLAGQCVMLDHAIRDAMGDLLTAATPAQKLKIRPQITALTNTYLKTLAELRRQRARTPEDVAAAPEPAAPAETPQPKTTAHAPKAPDHPPTGNALGPRLQPEGPKVLADAFAPPPPVSAVSGVALAAVSPMPAGGLSPIGSAGVSWPRGPAGAENGTGPAFPRKSQPRA